MSSFTQHLDVRHIDGRLWKVLSPFSYDVGFEGSGETIHVPKGFLTDFASIPRPLWWLYPPAGRWAAAALIHDRLYFLAGREVDGNRYTRWDADVIFLEGMEVLNVRLSTRWIMFLAVRAFGWWPWLKHKRNRKRENE